MIFLSLCQNRSFSLVELEKKVLIYYVIDTHSAAAATTTETKKNQLPIEDVKLINGIHIHIYRNACKPYESNLNEIFPELFGRVFQMYVLLHICMCVCVCVCCFSLFFRYFSV